MLALIVRRGQYVRPRMCWEPFARNSLGKPEEGARALSDPFTTVSRHPLSANQTATLGQLRAIPAPEVPARSDPWQTLLPSAAERRFQTFLPAPQNGEVRPKPPFRRAREIGRP